MDYSTTAIEYKGVIYTPEQLAEMREWVSDCQWNDLEPEEIADLEAITILRGVEKHYCGGLSDFLLAMGDMPAMLTID
jgi:hypothetical protein